MDVIVERAAGLDVHQSSVVARVVVGRAGERPRRERRTFGTMRRDLEALAAWLARHGVSHAAMESTGIYWMPVYAALEGRLTLVVAVILAEIGPNVVAFAGAHRLAAWAGLCPGNHQSAGRVRKSRLRRGNVHLKTALMMAAMGACRRNGSYLQAKYRKLKARLDAKRAQVAVAHKILIAIYHMLARDVAYRELGAACLDQINTARTVRSLVRRLKTLGYAVTLQEAPT